MQKKTFQRKNVLIKLNSLSNEMFNQLNYLNHIVTIPINILDDKNLFNRKKNKKLENPKFGTFKNKVIRLRAGGGVINDVKSKR